MSGNYVCKYAKYSYIGFPKTVYYLKEVYRLDAGFTAKLWTFTTVSGQIHSFPGKGVLE
jgi:hypothetical protein